MEDSVADAWLCMHYGSTSYNDFLRLCFPFSSPHAPLKREAGMNMSPVSRLKKTWAKVKTAKFDILEVCERDDSVLSG